MQVAVWQVRSRIYGIFDRKSWSENGFSECSPAEGLLI